MPKSLVLGNGSMFVGYDKYGLVHDIYYPHVGLDNHAGSKYVHKIGVWVDDKFSWLDDGSWQTEITCEKDTLVGNITAKNDRLEITLQFTDALYNEKDIYLRCISVKNNSKAERLIKVFFNQQFEIYGSRLKDTAYYDPIHKTIVHYKGRRVFLANATSEESRGFDEYSIGILGLEGKEGTFKDAEDGRLSENAIEHGSVDSVFSIPLQIKGEGKKEIKYWIIAAHSIRDTHELNNYVLSKSPDHLIRTTKDYWSAWVNKEGFTLSQLDPTLSDLFKQSLLYMRAHADDDGAIIASCDSDMLQLGRDNYSYMWPRDAAFTSISFDKAGDHSVTRRLFEFLNTLITEDGYFLHKYRPDRSLGSSWHPWTREGKIALPIQEDETALVIHALWVHYQKARDIEFIESIYNSLIKKAAQFMVSYRDKATGLPLPSYDIWERVWGTSTFTSSTVYAGLTAAAKFAKLLGKHSEEDLYGSVAEEIKASILKHLYNKDNGFFYKLINTDEGKIVHDTTIDASSIYGLYRFGVLEVGDKLVTEGIKKIDAVLKSKESGLGIARFENDDYYNSVNYSPGNPWIITTLWIAQYHIAKAKKASDMEPVIDILKWCKSKTNPAGILPEQVNPYTGEQLSASPLTWSHAEYVTTVIEYLEKLEELGVAESRTSNF